MERSRARYGWHAALFLALASVLITQTGCLNALAGILYVVKGRDEPPEFDELKGKKVAVVCRPLVQLRYSTGNVAEELSRKVSVMLKEKVKRIHVIDPQRVAEWTDENEWNDYQEIGEALGADMVVGIDLQRFELQQGQTLFQGTADTMLKVYDIKNHGEVVFQRKLPQTKYPATTGIPSSEITAEDFRQLFLKVLADEIGRYFYAHDPRADFASDARTL